MGSVGSVGNLISKINNAKFIPSKIDTGAEAYTITIPGVGKGGMVLSPNNGWNIVIARETGRKLELMDLPSGNGIDYASTRIEAEHLVKNWLRAIANGL